VFSFLSFDLQWPTHITYLKGVGFCVCYNRGVRYNRRVRYNHGQRHVIVRYGASFLSDRASLHQYYLVRGKRPSRRPSVRYKRGVCYIRYIRKETFPRDMKLGTL